jgi:hypothetical protein
MHKYWVKEKKEHGIPIHKPQVYLPKPEHGFLQGYHIHLSVSKRRQILKKVEKSESYSTMIKKLNELAILNKNRPEIYEIVESDLHYMQKQHK